MKKLLAIVWFAVLAAATAQGQEVRTVTYSDGSKYVGTFNSSGQRHGKGTYYWTNGDKYEGDWKNNSRTGKGIFYWEQEKWRGDRYKGDFVNNNRHGKGIYYYANGRMDIGLFKENKYIGIDPAMPFSEYAKTVIVPKINEWQKKGEFEKTADWQVRVTEQTRRAKIAELTNKAEKEYIANTVKDTSLSLVLGNYDADNEVYLVSGGGKNLLVPVPIGEAQTFKANWTSITKTPKYFIENDRLAISEVAFAMPNGKTYKYSNAASLNYTVAQVDYNFAPIEIAANGTTTQHPQGQQTISTVNLAVGKADVDINIPSATVSNPNALAVIIANERYDNVGSVEFALNDGVVFGEYCRKVLGIPEKNITIRKNATYGNMRGAVNLLEELATAYGGTADIIFYYVGHGIPDEATGDAYLLPTDGIPSDTETCFSVNELYKRLGAMNAARVTVFTDACFSGARRDGSALVAARGVAIKSKSAAPGGKTIIFSAAQGDETAHPYREKQHGLFTYYLLKKLQETRGEATFGELAEYITRNVKIESLQTNKRTQTPTVSVTPELNDSWRAMKLKRGK